MNVHIVLIFYRVWRSLNKKALTNVFGIIFVNKNKKVLNKYGPDLIIIILKNLDLNLFCNQFNTQKMWTIRKQQKGAIINLVQLVLLPSFPPPSSLLLSSLLLQLRNDTKSMFSSTKLRYSYMVFQEHIYWRTVE